MKKLILAALVALAAFVYLHPSIGAERKTVVQRPAAPRATSTTIVVASSASYADRWKTGPNAQTDLKTGPNAQTSFEPFAPSEQADWNNTPGYTIVAGRSVGGMRLAR